MEDSDIRFCEWMLHETKKMSNSNTHRPEKLIIDMKRKIRKERKMGIGGGSSHFEIDDRYVCKFLLPRSIDNCRDAECFLKECISFDLYSLYYVKIRVMCRKSDGRFCAYFILKWKKW